VWKKKLIQEREGKTEGMKMNIAEHDVLTFLTIKNRENSISCRRSGLMGRQFHLRGWLLLPRGKEETVLIRISQVEEKSVTREVYKIFGIEIIDDLL
jgi:hypothetical protein